MCFFYKISGIEHNKLILFLILIINVNYEKIQVFFCIYWKANDSFVFIIANQKFCRTSGNTELPQLDLR